MRLTRGGGGGGGRMPPPPLNTPLGELCWDSVFVHYTRLLCGVEFEPSFDKNLVAL